MMILKNSCILDFGRQKVEEGRDILIDGSRIAEVGSRLSAAHPEAEVLDLHGAPVSPGLVCSHNHFYSGLARGIMAKINPTPDFVSILRNLWWRLDQAIDEPILEYSALVCLMDALKAGTTAVVDHHASPGMIQGSLGILRRAFERVGMRGILCYEATDRHGMEDLRRGVDENVSFAKEITRDRQADPDLPVEAAIGGHAPFTLPDEGLQLLSQAVEETGKGFHCHIAEGAFDVSHSHLRYGKDIVRRLDSFGLLNEKALMVHGVCLSEEEIDLLNERGAFLLHNARSNMNNAVGYNPFMGKVKNPGLGTDGIGSNMFEAFKTAFFKAQEEKTGLFPGDILRIMNGGNRILESYFGQRFGTITAGAQADLVIYDYLAPTPLRDENLAGHLAFGMGAQDVRSVMVNGKFLLKDRAFAFDAAPLYARAREEAQRLWDRMDRLD